MFGPTASGKSAVAEAIAARIPAELVSADSAQVYRGLPILTNQSPARLVGIWDLDHEASVGEYQELAHEAIDEILAAGRTPIVVGGTGLYFRAALTDLDIPPPPAPGVRERFERLYDEVGAEKAHAILQARDRRAAAAIHPNDRRRVVRALELVEVDASLNPVGNRLWSMDTRHPGLLIGLQLPKHVLSVRIAVRTRTMFDDGVQDEVKAALAGPVSATAMRVLGLREVAELPSEEAIESVIHRTHRLAQYQRKWMRRRVPVTVNANRPAEEVAHEILEMARGWEHLPLVREGPTYA